jgi:hypothetical protein
VVLNTRFGVDNDDEEDEFGEDDEDKPDEDDDEEDDNGGEGYSEGDKDGDAPNGRETIERFKDDLFAEDDNDDPADGTATFNCLRTLLSSRCFIQVDPLSKSVKRKSQLKSQSWSRRMLHQKNGC